MKDMVYVAKVTTRFGWLDGEIFYPHKKEIICVSTSMDTVIANAKEFTKEAVEKGNPDETCSECDVCAWCDGKEIGVVLYVLNGEIAKADLDWEFYDERK